MSHKIRVDFRCQQYHFDDVATEDDKMAEKVDLEIVVAVDEDGNWCVCRAYDDVGEKIGEMASENGTQMVRCVNLTVAVTPLTAIEATVDVPDEAGKEVKVSIG
jgi:hypothetical protein